MRTVLGRAVGRSGSRRPRAFRPDGPAPLEPRWVPVALPAGYTATQVVSRLGAPSVMEFAPDGRLFLAGQDGTIRIVKDDALLPAPFARLAVTVEGERGLSGLAFDPDFATNSYLYVYYTTAEAPIRNRISRLTASGDSVVPGSEVVLVDLPRIDTRRLPFHNGGALHFGPDGHLYVGVGDHKDRAAAQSLRSPFGKILRFRKDGTIPEDNPFYARTTGVNRAIWATGFRNPFTFAFQPGTGRLFANDVGETTWEEVNAVVPGANYGWPNAEGMRGGRRFARPLHVYRHGDGPGQGCAIVGGAFYPGSGPFADADRGRYYYSEYCRGEIRQVDPETGATRVFASGLPAFGVDLDVAPDGSLYYASRSPSNPAAGLYRIEYAVDEPPRIVEPPLSQVVSLGRGVLFQAGVAGTTPFSYQWQRDGVDIPGAVGPSYAIAAAAPGDHGASFRVVVSNAFGAAVSAGATLAVTANQPPTATILAPSAALRWRRGDRIHYAGAGFDPEEGALPPSAFTWQVDLLHDDHAHPFVAPTSGRADGRFRIPRPRHDAGLIRYRITLTVTDSTGLTGTATRDIFPRGSRQAPPA